MEECYKKNLSEEEIARMNRFHFEKDRKNFLISHTFLRQVVSKYINSPPSSIQYALNDYGKPSLLLNDAEPELSFNLSHTNGLVCCALAKGGEMGVDVELCANCHDVEELGERFFSSSESSAMMALESSALRKERFYQIWVLKEAYIKAKGLGLSLPLHLFSIHFRKKEELFIEFDEQLKERFEQWKIFLLKPTEEFRIGIAYKPLSSVKGKNRLKTFQTTLSGKDKELRLSLLGESKT